MPTSVDAEAAIGIIAGFVLLLLFVIVLAIVVICLSRYVA